MGTITGVVDRSTLMVPSLGQAALALLLIALTGLMFVTRRRRFN